MKIIELNGSGWVRPLDFLGALRLAIGAPEWHGSSPDAFVDSMIWQGINSVSPPYTVRVTGLNQAPAEVLDYVDLIGRVLKQADKEYFAQKGIRSGVNLMAIWADG